MYLLQQNLMIMGRKAMGKVKEFLHDEKGAVDIVAIVVLIGVAVLLALVFKNQLSNLIKNLFAVISGNATDAVGTSISN